MSGAGTAAKPRVRFCWSCSRKLHANFHRVVLVEGVERVVHAACARKDGLYIVEGKHLTKERVT